VGKSIQRSASALTCFEVKLFAHNAAFVEYEDMRDADDAIRKLDGELL
jgi:hypothetical protein